MNDFKEPKKTIQGILEKHKSKFFGMRRFKNNNRMGSDNN
jgi:hypothetical protein